MRPDLAQDTLDSHAAVHDRTQFEVKFTYDVSAGNISQGKDDERYRIEAFFFFPRNMGVTALNFPKEAFYRSLHAYIRFKTPILSELALLDPMDRQSPLNAISFYLKRLNMGQGTAKDVADAENEARLFGCVVSSQLKHYRHELERHLSAAKRHPADVGRWRELEGFLFDALSTMDQLIGRYRMLVLDFRTTGLKLDPKFLAHLRQVDEFLTYRYDETLSGLHYQLSAIWEAPERLERIIERLRAVAEAEGRHRKAQGFVQLAPSDEEALALYTYRQSALKKLVEQVLYLDVKTVQETVRWRNLAAMFGAGAAAFFAGTGDRTIVFPLFVKNFWLAVAIFAILYVIKDRMKEIGREYIWTRVSRYFPDNKLIVHDPVKDLNIGSCTERVRYADKGKISKDVLSVRNFNHSIDLDEEREETVIVYQNDVTLNAREILASHQRRQDIKHILRFSVEDLFARMDNPTARVQFYDAASRLFCRLRAPKVYHLNVVFRFTRWDDKNQKGEPTYQRIRVVLDKNGIHRIDSVVEGCRAHDLLPSIQRVRNTGPLHPPGEKTSA
ncbi:hypothetical protein D3C72_907320 [compost metagenome]